MRGCGEQRGIVSIYHVGKQSIFNERKWLCKIYYYLVHQRDFHENKLNSLFIYLLVCPFVCMPQEVFDREHSL